MPALVPALVVAVLLLASPASAQDRPGLVIPAVVFAGLQAADVHSTHLAISNGTGREGNPFMRLSTGEQAAVKAAMTVGTVVLLSKLHTKKPRAAKVTFWTLNAVMVGVVAHNYRVARRR